MNGRERVQRGYNILYSNVLLGYMINTILSLRKFKAALYLVVLRRVEVGGASLSYDICWLVSKSGGSKSSI